MPSYKHPGVYVKELSSGPRLIEGAETSVAAFVGNADKGPAGRAELVQSFDDYKSIYGGIASQGDTLGLAVQSFFINGGRSAYICRLAGEGSELATAKDYADFYDRILQKIRDVSILLLPGVYLASDGSGNKIINATLAHCEKMKNRMAIIDPPPGLELDQAAVSRLALPTSSYAALYYPWVKVANPLYNAMTSSKTDKTIAVAPSAFAAGIWSRFDHKLGVWKAPAGMEAGINGAVGLQYKVGDAEQSQLNPSGVNCIRDMSKVGTVIWGSRSLATKTDPEWRYIPVRRTANMIEQSIFEGTQWAVFEPNDHRLWSSLRSNIASFMDGLFRRGALQGASASDAYFVRCGLGDTMTQPDIDAGNVIVIVGFAPLKPAEFVIVRIRHKVR